MRTHIIRTEIFKNKMATLVAILFFITASMEVSGQLTIYANKVQAGTSASCAVYTIYTNSGIPGGLNDDISSITLQQGYMATLAENSDGSGNSYSFIAAVSNINVDLNPLLDNKVSFIRVLPFRNTLKKGVGLQDNSQIDKLNVSWFYDWGASDVSTAGREYALMSWGRAGANNQTNIDNYISKTDLTHLLSFNEPDNVDQSNISATEAVTLHKNLSKTGLRLGSPATTEGQVLVWLKDFMSGTRAANNKVDYVAIHWYDWGSYTSTGNTAPDPNGVFSRFKTYVNSVYAMYGKPIWITEFNANRNTTSATHEAFIALALPWLEAQPFVERYAYFFPPALPPVDAGGNLTPIGTAYKNFAASTPAISKNYDNSELLTEDLGVKLEAETDAYLFGNTITSCATASGGSMVGAVTGSNKTVFHDVVVFNSGTFNFNMSYFNLASKTINVRANYGNAVASTIPASGALWCYQGGSPGVATLSLNLLAGKNTIEFTETPILDYIQLANVSLPSRLLRFSGVAQQRTIDLNWRTAQEQQTRSFEVQRSADGIAFSTIGTVAAAGNSNAPLDYAFVDKDPLKGIGHYRLRIVDADDRVQFSPTVTIRFGASSTEHLRVIAAGPSSITVSAYSTRSTEAMIRIMNIDGRIFSTRQVILKEGTNTIQLPVSLTGGSMGVVQLINGNMTNTEKFILR